MDNERAEAGLDSSLDQTARRERGQGMSNIPVQLTKPEFFPISPPRAAGLYLFRTQSGNLKMNYITSSPKCCIIIERAGVDHGIRCAKRQFSRCGLVRGLHNWRNCGSTNMTWDDNICLFPPGL